MENVTNWFKTNKLVFWRIVDKTTGSVVSKFDDEENTEDSVSLLSQNLSFLRDGKYSIFARKNIKGVNGELEFPFTIGNAKAEIAGYGNSEIGYIMQIEALKRELDKKDFDNKLEQLKVKFKAEDDKPDMFDKILKVLNTFKEVEKGAPASTAEISGVEQEKLATNLEDISNALGQENFLKLAEKLAAWAKMNPELVKKQLKESGLL